MEDDSYTEAEIWMGAYVAAYAITLLSSSLRRPNDIDVIAERHASFVTQKIIDHRAAQQRAEETDDANH